MTLSPALLRRLMPASRLWQRLLSGLLVAMLVGVSVPTEAQSVMAAELDGTPATTSGPVRLRQPVTQPGAMGAGARRDASSALGAGMAPGLAAEPTPRRVGDFERYVNRLTAPETVRRFGSELVEPPLNPDVQDFNPLVPPDYLVQPGDEVTVSIWGTVDADLRLTVDRSGRIAIPRVGSVMVAGVRYADLNDTIGRRVGQVFRNYQISVGLGQLRGLRVYVTGFANKPGAVTVSSLSTVTGVLLAAGGPSDAGSLRAVQLRRGRDVVATLDLYELLLKGDRSADRVVQAEDVIHVGPIGTQVAMIGSVNRPGIFELKPGEAMADLLNMAGGFSAVADRKRLYLERLGERDTNRVTEVRMPESERTRLDTGDVVRALSAVDLATPQQLKNKRVRVEGEVNRPGEFVLPADGTISTALAAAGGLTPSAYVFGTEFNRNSVRLTQAENYDRAIRDLETDITRRTTTQRTSSSEEAAAQGTRFANASRLLERLRTLKPSGRIVLELTPSASNLPDLALEDGDRLYIPARSSTVGVFGSVFNPGSYLFAGGRQLDDYLQLAGGPTKGADGESILVVRANGSVVVSKRQNQGWFRSRSALEGVQAEAGDTIFVPEEVDKSTFMQNAKDWTSIFYNFGLGAAAIRTILN